ncbi:MAG TPA: hypothetical protein VN802_20450 [Stellaceae bacterium]|nr:hypothetical protein [Stellaceae bacterium]
METAITRNRVAKPAKTGASKRRSGRSIAVVGVMAGAMMPYASQAGQLKYFVTDLFGGHGLVINDIAEPAENLGLSGSTLAQINTISSSISSSLGGTALTSSLTSSAFDISQGLAVTKTESLGPVVGERAETLGQGKLDLGISYSHTTFTELNGAPLNNLNLFVISPPGQDDTANIALNIKLERQVVALSSTYGITPKWDVGIVVPLVEVKATASATATLNPGPDAPFDSFLATGTNAVHSQTGGEKGGLGDIAVRTKYNFVRDQSWLPDISGFGQVQLPTGDAENLLGSGSTDILGEIILSKQLGLVAPHLNLGYEQAIAGADKSNIRYVAGADVHILDNLTGAVDLVGRGQPGSTDTLDIAFGARWRPFDIGVIGANFSVPLNKSVGLRPDYSWSVSANFTF